MFAMCFCPDDQAASSPTLGIPEGLADLVKALQLKDADDEEMTYESHRRLEPERAKVMATVFPDLDGSGKHAVAILAKRGEAAREFVAEVRESNGRPELSLVTGSCQITYEELTPSECVEYAFAEAPTSWAMAQLSLDALETYRGMKFDAWKAMLVNPTCEAQFRRMLQIGMISKLYDPQVFPTPADLKAKYQVTDEKTGKLIELPHPVHTLRRWGAATQRYESIETELTGAQAIPDKAAWWRNFVEEMRAKHGGEYIDGLLGGGGK